MIQDMPTYMLLLPLGVGHWSAGCTSVSVQREPWAAVIGWKIARIADCWLARRRGAAEYGVAGASGADGRTKAADHLAGSGSAR